MQGRTGNSRQWILQAAVLLLLSVHPARALAEALPSPGGIIGFPRVDFDTIAFIGTVTRFESPVYGLSEVLDPVSIIHFNVEERILGSDNVSQLVSYGALWADEGGEVIYRGCSSQVTRALYVNPGMRLLIIGSRRNQKMAEAQGYQFSGYFVATFCRLLPSTPVPSKAVPLQIIGDIIPPKNEPDSNRTLVGATTGPFNVPTYPDTTLTLDFLKTKIREIYGSH